VEEVLDHEDHSALYTLTYDAFHRACNHADFIFRRLEESISARMAGTLRLEWVNTNRAENWASRARLFMPRARSNIGGAGLWLGYDATALRLFGWLWPRYGGLDGRREVVRVCKQKVSDVCLPYEHPEEYPGLTEDDGVLWLDERLTTKTSADELAERTSKQAKLFFRAAKPVLALLMKA
jgi:hypothetical protein